MSTPHVTSILLTHSKTYRALIYPDVAIQVTVAVPMLSYAPKNGLAPACTYRSLQQKSKYYKKGKLGSFEDSTTIGHLVLKFMINVCSVFDGL